MGGAKTDLQSFSQIRQDVCISTRRKGRIHYSCIGSQVLFWFCCCLQAENWMAIRRNVYLRTRLSWPLPNMEVFKQAASKTTPLGTELFVQRHLCERRAQHDELRQTPLASAAERLALVPVLCRPLGRQLVAGAASRAHQHFRAGARRGGPPHPRSAPARRWGRGSSRPSEPYCCLCKAVVWGYAPLKRSAEAAACGLLGILD